MEAVGRKIFDIFNGNTVFEVPFFQRSYVWKDENWKRLLEDLETACQTQRPYFLGAIILKQKMTSTGSEIRTIVDGQQRLTTLAILLKVLCLKTEAHNKFDKRFRLDDGRPVILHSHSDIDAFNTIMDLNQAVLLHGTGLITQAYNYFFKELNLEKIDFDTIGRTILFAVIDLAIDEDEQQIFDTINSLGVDLTTPELLKNHLFGRNDWNYYQEYWVKVFERDERIKKYWNQSITAGRTKRTMIDLFLDTFLQVKARDPILGVKGEDKLMYSRVDKVYDSYKHFIRDYYHGNTHPLLEEMKSYAEVFRESFTPDVVEKELPAYAGIHRINALIFALETTTLIPYVLYIEKTVQDENDRNHLYEYLESFIMRRIITRAGSKNYNQLFTDRLINENTATKAGLEAYFDSQEEKINGMPDDEEIKDVMHNKWLSNKNAAGVLYMIESKIRKRNFHSTKLLGIKHYSLEHIMPKNWRKNWSTPPTQELIEARDQIRWTLGNLTIITQSLNSSIRDADWETKINGKGNNGGLLKYSEGIETASDYLKLDDWNEATIKKRADFLNDLALKIWPKS